MMDDREPDSLPNAEHAWAMLSRLHECVVRSLGRGDEYDRLVSAVRDARDLLSRHAAAAAPDMSEQCAEDQPRRKAA